MLVGLISSLVLIALSPAVWNPEPGVAILTGTAIFPLENPGIVSIPLGFLGASIGTFVFSTKRDTEKYTEIVVNAHTGLKVAQNQQA